jgi:hypothetical protein
MFGPTSNPIINEEIRSPFDSRVISNYPNKRENSITSRANPFGNQSRTGTQNSVNQNIPFAIGNQNRNDDMMIEGNIIQPV